MADRVSEGLSEEQRALCQEAEKRITLHYLRRAEELFSIMLESRGEGEVGRKGFEKCRNYLVGMYFEADELAVNYVKRFDLDEL